ncbi:unnamed protein product, partial [Prorocentrum cordatum]
MECETEEKDEVDEQAEHHIGTPDTPAGAQKQAPTLQEIVNMFRQEVTPLQRAISDLENKVTRMGDMMDSRMSAVEGKIDNCETRIADLEKQHVSLTNTPRSDCTANAEIWEQLKALELQIATLNVSDSSSADNKAERDKTLVIGGLQSFGGVQEVKEWASNRLWDALGPQPQDTYTKGDFWGIVFLKEWGYESKAVWADPEDGKVWVGDVVAVHGHVDENKLSVDYGPGWKEWLTDPAFPEYTAHVAKLSSKLENVPTKGSGKAAFKGKAKGGKGRFRARWSRVHGSAMGAEIGRGLLPGYIQNGILEATSTGGDCKEDANRHLLVETCTHLKMCLANTFFDVPLDRLATSYNVGTLAGTDVGWQTHSQIDFLVCEESWLHKVRGVSARRE